MSKSFESSMDNDIGFPKNSRVKVRLATLSYSLLFYIPWSPSPSSSVLGRRGGQGALLSIYIFALTRPLSAIPSPPTIWGVVFPTRPTLLGAKLCIYRVNKPVDGITQRPGHPVVSLSRQSKTGSENCRLSPSIWMSKLFFAVCLPVCLTEWYCTGEVTALGKWK